MMQCEWNLCSHEATDTAGLSGRNGAKQMGQVPSTSPFQKPGDEHVDRCGPLPMAKKNASHANISSVVDSSISSAPARSMESSDRVQRALILAAWYAASATAPRSSSSGAPGWISIKLGYLSMNNQLNYELWSIQAGSQLNLIICQLRIN